MNYFRFFDYIVQSNGIKRQIIMAIKDGDLFLMSRENPVDIDKIKAMVSKIGTATMNKYSNHSGFLDSDFPIGMKLFIGERFRREISCHELEKIFIPMAKTGIAYLTKSNT